MQSGDFYIPSESALGKDGKQLTLKHGAYHDTFMHFKQGSNCLNDEHPVVVFTAGDARKLVRVFRGGELTDGDDEDEEGEEGDDEDEEGEEGDDEDEEEDGEESDGDGDDEDEDGEGEDEEEGSDEPPQGASCTTLASSVIANTSSHYMASSLDSETCAEAYALLMSSQYSVYEYARLAKWIGIKPLKRAPKREFYLLDSNGLRAVYRWGQSELSLLKGHLGRLWKKKTHRRFGRHSSKKR